MSSPHINAAAGDFAETVLLPGDPLRAQHIAMTLLEGAVEVNSVRNMLGYTGTWRGKRLSVMGGGMGIPSTLIYATELVRDFGVKRFVRAGTCGAVSESLAIGDIVLGLGAGTDSRVNRIRFRDYDLAATASWSLLRKVIREAESRGREVRVGNVFSTDIFYHPDPELKKLLARMGVLAIEMEAAGLYALAAELGVEALAVMTVSDHLLHDEQMTSAQRATGVDDMVRLVLDALTAD